MPNALDTVLTYAQYATLVLAVSYLDRMAWHALRHGWRWCKAQIGLWRIGRAVVDEDAIINGTGKGEPLGILYASSAATEWNFTRPLEPSEVDEILLRPPVEHPEGK